MALPSPRSKNRSMPRLYVIDQVRGLAIIGVVVFHLVWDATFAGLIPAGFANHVLWIAYGRALAGTFMFLVGVSLVLANRSEIIWPKAIRRVLIIVVAAFAITVVTYFTFQTAFVFYGILQAIAIASLLGILFLRLPIPLVFTIGIVVWFLPLFVTSEAFDSRWLAWIGFAQSPPSSIDLVPIFPWLGITLVGIALTRLSLRNGLDTHFSIEAPVTRFGRFLTFCGRHSLAIYLLHQPILLAVITPFSR